MVVLGNSCIWCFILWLNQVPVYTDDGFVNPNVFHLMETLMINTNCQNPIEAVQINTLVKTTGFGSTEEAMLPHCHLNLTVEGVRSMCKLMIS